MRFFLRSVFMIYTLTGSLIMSKVFAIKICLILSVFCFTKAQVTDKQGGYSVLVSFSQNVKYEDGERLVQTFQETLQNSSAILYDAIGRSFTKVIFKIPNSWDISEWNVTADDSDVGMDAKADFLIDNTVDTVFGKFPFAQQYGSCGTPGHQLVVPTEFLSDTNEFPPGLALAREWLKYRYGVFDENGFIGDSLYPASYIQPGGDAKEVKITECTNSPIVYNFKDKETADCAVDDPPLAGRLNSGECSAIPDQDSLENVTSSLMYFHKDIVSMLHVCGKEDIHPHYAMSPNKHNALCRGQSIWDIIKSSKDFQDEPSTDNYEEIEYYFVRKSLPKVIVAWENTANINSAKMGGVILNSIKRLIYDLPDESKFCGFPFSNILSEDKDYTLRTLSTIKDKNDIMPNILSDFIRNTTGDVNLAISKAMDILSSDENNPTPEGTIIVITMSNVQPDSSLLERLQRHPKVCVLLLYLGVDSIPDNIGNFVNSLKCGFLKFVKTDEEEKDIFTELFSTMELVLPETVDDKKTETVTTGYLTKNSSVVFEADETVETLTFWVFTDKESENFELKFNDVNNKFTNMKTTAIMALAFSPSEVGSVEFSYPFDTSPIFTQVRSTSKAGMYIKGHVFTYDTSGNSSPDIQMPVIIYAMIRFGSYPVQNAAVHAMVTTPDGNTITFELFDDGRGDPDITENDGVYSRYFTQFTVKGEYIVTVIVTTQDLSSYGKDEDAGYQTCCGSFVKTVSSKLPKVSKQFRTSFHARNGRPEDGYKPARVLDFRIDSATDDKIVLKWSAPGGEGDTGTASRYEIVPFCGEDNSTDCNTYENIRVMDLPLPASLGQVQQATIQILKKMHISLGIISYNEKNKSSDLSNIIQIKGLSEITETTTIVTDTSYAPRSSTSIIIFSIFICIALICLIVGIVYYFRRKSRRTSRKNSMTQQSIDITDQIKPNVITSGPLEKTVPMKRIESFPVMLFTHDQIKDRRESGKYPPLYKTDIPPKPWASLDAVTSLKTADWTRDTKSLGSSSTVDATDEFEIKGIKSSN